MSQLPTAKEVTNLFLYGQTTTPSNLTSESLIRPNGYTLPPRPVDTDTYMAGPGRFATPDKFEIVKKFLNPLTDLTSFQLAPGAYTKEMLWTAFGISLLGQDFSRRAVLIDQTEHDDGKDDFLERAYIWNTTAFSIKDGARFIVEMNGTRYIEDFAVVPFLNGGVKENFDFVAGSTFGSILNSFLEPKVDPSKIGRRVDFDFSTNRTVQGRFTLDDYIAASTSSSAAPANLLLGAYILANGTDFVDRLYNSGATKFLDNTGRFIAYDGTGANSLSPATFDNIAIDRNLRVALNTIGIHLIGGSGSDALLGGVRGDVLNGGVGADTLTGGLGNDYLEGGQDLDTYQFSGTWGLDTIVDTDGQGFIQIDGTTLAGGAQYGDARVSRDTQDRTYTQAGNGRLIVDGSIIIEGYSAGTLGLSMTGAVADVDPITSGPTILGDLQTNPLSFGIANMGSLGGQRDMHSQALLKWQ